MFCEIRVEKMGYALYVIDVSIMVSRRKYV